MDTTTHDFIDTLTTEDDALDAINAIRARFDLAGTVFCTADVTETVRAALAEDHPDLADALAPDIAERVKDTYYWRKLGDIMSDRGGETIADAVTDACGPLAGDADAEYTAQLLVQHGQTHIVAIEGIGFFDAGTAYTWAAGHLGSSVATVLESRPNECDLHVPTDALFHGTIESIALMVKTSDSHNPARFVATTSTESDGA